MKNPSIILLALCLNPLLLFTSTPLAEARSLAIVGGYEEVDAEDEELLDAADFVLTAMFSGYSDRSYSFSTLLLGENNEGVGDDKLIAKVVEAQSQVSIWA